MKEWFDTAGHLTDDALDALITESLDELSCLEISEHLSFCDDCLVRYTARLSDELLEAPPEPVAPSVMSRIRRNAIAFFCSKYVTMAVGAVAAISLWISGAFAVYEKTDLSQFLTRIENTSQTLVQGSSDFSNSVSDAISGLFESIKTKGTDFHEKK